MDPQKLAQEMLDAVKKYVADGISGLGDRFAAIDRRIDEIPAGKKGDAGERGEKGEPGQSGEKGENGKDGRDGKDGASGRDGVDGKDGARGEKGEPGRDGVDGKSVTIDDVTPLIETMFAKSLLDYERRFGEAMAKAIREMPKPKDGVDGLSIEDLELEHDGVGNITLRFVRGDVRKEFVVRVPCFRDRGVYREDVKDYRQGDGCTFGGSYWIAQRDDPEGKPGDGAPDGERGKGNGHWRLAVNKGRDGRRDPPPAPSGPVKF